MKQWKSLILILIAGVLCLSGTISILAAQELDPEQFNEQTGTIEIRLEPAASGRPSQGVEFEAYRVADLVQSEFVFLEPYQECSLKSSQLDQSEPMKEAIRFLKEHKTTPQASAEVDSDGSAFFKELPYSLYLFVVSNPAQYELIGDFLGILPIWNAEEQKEENRITIRVKPNPIPDVQIQKIDPDNQPICNAKFVFAAYNDAKKTGMIAAKSADTTTGTVVFRPNLGQTMYIKEITAPTGYQLSERLVKVTMDLDGSVYIDDQKKEPVDNLVTIPYENTPLTVRVPETNGDTPAPTPDQQITTPGPGNNTPVIQTTPPTSTPTYSPTKPATATATQAGLWLSIGAASGGVLAAGALYLAWEKKKKPQRRRPSYLDQDE